MFFGVGVSQRGAWVDAEAHPQAKTSGANRLSSEVLYSPMRLYKLNTIVAKPLGFMWINST